MSRLKMVLDVEHVVDREADHDLHHGGAEVV